MAKEGIESFLLDCHTNDNMAEIEAVYGIKGFAVIVRLWQKIYSEKGYYCEWIERSPLLFLAQWFGGNSGVDLNLIIDIVSKAVKIGIFDAGKLSQYSILTSEGIQKRYFDVVKRRTVVSVIDEYLLVSVDNLGGNVCRNSISVDRKAVSVNRNATSKGKVSKGKVSKEKESKGKESEGEKAYGAKAPQTVPRVYYPNDEKLDTAFRNYVDMRRKIRKPMTEAAIDLAMKKLEKLSDSHQIGSMDHDMAIEILEQSILNSWQGLFPIKNNTGRSNRDGSVFDEWRGA